MSTLVEFQQVAERAARVAGEVLLDWGHRFTVREKGPADLVTEADLASQETIRKIILGAYPQHGFLAEEDSSIPSQDEGYRWIVDPLDGTTNFVHRVANFGVSIALEQEGKPLVGVVYDPTTGELFSATAGGGAWLNGQPLQVSGVEQMDQAMIAISFAARVARDSTEIANFIEVQLKAQSTRRMGSSALNLCYLAAGRFDGYWATATKIWDIAAAVLLVQEAGGVITHMDGGPVDINRPQFIAAATPSLHKQLSGLLRK